jgi:RimJ/RimL family protein N-acetyltransferase
LSDLLIRRLEPRDAEALSGLLVRDPPSYRQYFVGLPDDPGGLAVMLERARDDLYWGLHWNGQLVGVVMLRGLDDGFAVPAFGVYIAQAHAGKGLSRLALEHATAFCRLSGREEIMLTVHPDHYRARALYERAGFRSTGELSRIGHGVYRKALIRT